MPRCKHRAGAPVYSSAIVLLNKSTETFTSTTTNKSVDRRKNKSVDVYAASYILNIAIYSYSYIANDIVS